MPETSSLHNGIEKIVFQVSMKVLFAGMTIMQTTIITIEALCQMENIREKHTDQVLLSHRWLCDKSHYPSNRSSLRSFQIQ